MAVCAHGMRQHRGEGSRGDVLTSWQKEKEEGGKVSHLGVYHRGTCLCLVHVSKANLRAFCLSFSQFIRQIPLLFVTANMVLVKDGSRSARLSLKQLGWECAAVRDHTRLHLAFLLPHFSTNWHSTAGVHTSCSSGIPNGNSGEAFVLTRTLRI